MPQEVRPVVCTESREQQPRICRPQQEGICATQCTKALRIPCIIQDTRSSPTITMHAFYAVQLVVEMSELTGWQRFNWCQN
jgi:hypothetical protein